ncbi:MAG: MFS transporter [Verrucomicrobia bacterium]|nr:MFS transporter [Verrucomicrobiota bacterium]
MTKRPIPHLRWYIAFLLCLASALNYLDRQTLSVLIGTIKEDLGLNNADYGTINAWFLVSYGVMYAVSGRIIDFVGTRKGFTIFVAGWSLANMLHIFAATVGQFSFFRFLLGVFEPGSFTGGVRAVSEWFPMRDRALAIGIFNAGTAFGSMAAAPIVSVIAVHWGWRAAFLVTGALGFVWVAGWWVLYKLPKDHPRLSEEERQLILSDQPQDSASERPAPLLGLLRMKETWGCVLVRALTDPISYFLLFWMPLYFQHKHGFDLKQIGMFVWIPYAVAAIGNVFSGAMPRWLISRGWELNSARKLTMGLMTCLMLVFCLIVPQVANPALALAIVAGMTFCHAGWGNIILPAEVFPKNAVGTVTGLGGALGSLIGALSQRYIGRVVDDYGFAPIFLACAGLYPLALLMVQLLIGKLGVVRKVS